ncbi:unnamed protein product [Bursaphelenchus okinawaensis]|uniref:G-protein coupled receptors family 1 profile domain-containing protein n=1 Tax=Bursaphelenchus okinawaensis TaxID=465554 RepID=A0A811K524_9BILA|nr:unnamed protein product [Bursaphelenchus okinawaensis]CAG9091486.1 unnamed protein product [Bursaphelenchus okinawaensis]
MNSTTEATFDCDDGSLLDRFEVRMVVMFVYIMVFLLCLVGNLFTIIVICVHRSMRTATNFFLGNLAFADLLVAVFCILQNMFHIVGSNSGHWPLGAVVCKLYVLMLHMVPCTGIGILVCVSLEKYIAVLHPLLALKLLTPRLRAFMMTSIWIGSLVINLPYYFTTVERRYHQFAACTRDMSSLYGPFSFTIKDMITLSFVTWYIIPLTTIAILYSRIGLVLWRSSMKPLSVRPSTTSPSAHEAMTTMTFPENGNGDVDSMADSNRSVDETPTVVKGDVLESRKKIIRLLIAIVTSFAVLTLPHHARLLHVMWSTEHSCNSKWTSLLQPFTYITLFMSSSINPILYAFMSQRFRAAVKDIMKCRSRGYLRKYTRTRTILSDIPEHPSRSPSLSHNNVRTTCM